MSISPLPPDMDTYCQSKHHNYKQHSMEDSQGRAEGVRIKATYELEGEARKGL